MGTVYGYIDGYPHIVGEIVDMGFNTTVFICSKEEFSQLKGFSAWYDHEWPVKEFYRKNNLQLPKDCRFIPFAYNANALIEIGDILECLLIELSKELK